MMLHEKKRESLLSWVQSAGGHDVVKLADLANGKLLSQLVIALSDKDCDLSGVADNDLEKPDSANLSQDSVIKKEQQDLTEETTDSSINEIESNIQEPGIVNGYHDSSNDELKQNGTTNHSELVIKAEAEDAVSENGATVESSPALSEEIVSNSHIDYKDEDTTDYVINGTGEEESPIHENANQLDCSYDALKVTNSVSLENCSSLKSDTELIIPADSDASEVQSHYHVVQKFIENMLELTVPDLVDFHLCIEANELEIAKLTVLLLSAMVQYSLSTKKDHIMASCYSLSAAAQEEIMDSLELFLKDRQTPVEQKEFHCRLSRCAKLRISPRKHANAMSTPHSNKPARRGRKRKVYHNNVEEFLDKGFESPIQNLIKSPDIRHITPNSEARLLEAVRCKDKTIALLTYDLDVEKYNADELKKQKEDLNLQLSKLRKEKEKLKKELDEVQTSLENNELAFEKAQSGWKNEAKSYQSQIKDLKEAEKFWKESYQMEDVETTQKPDCTCSEQIDLLRCALQAKDDKIQELTKQIEISTVQVQKLCQEREDLERQLEENVSSDIKPSYERPPNQEKFFNVSDLSLRNELKEKCEELQRYISEQEFEYSERIQKLEELILEKEKVEKEWKARFRKTDKEREDAINRQKKLEVENSNLKAQIEVVEVFKKVIPDITSHVSPKDSTSLNSTPANRRSSRIRNACDSEKIGQLWHTFEGESSKSHGDSGALSGDATKTAFEPDRPSPQSANKSLNKKASEKSPRNKLWPSHSASTSELGDSITTCKMCSQCEFPEVPPLVQNLCKIVRENSILDADVLFELHKYERDFNLSELVSALALITTILKERASSSGAIVNPLKRKRQSGGLESDKNSPEKVKMSRTSEPEQPRKGTVSGDISQRPELDAAESQDTAVNDNDSDVHKHNYQYLYNVEKRKVARLQIKLKNSKNVLASKEEELKKLQVQLSKTIELRDTYLERCKRVMKNYELNKEELMALKRAVEDGRPEPIIKTVVKTIPPPPCETCKLINEKLTLYRQAKKNAESQVASLNDSVKAKNSEIESLKREICKLYKKKNELEEKLSDPAIVSLGVYSPSLKTIREKLLESRFDDVKSDKDGSQESENPNASSVTNCSFTVPSTDGFAHSSRNQTQLRAFCKAEDEAEMLSQSSIFERQSDTTPGDRLYEINRRNTLCLPHLKSQYPLELNMTPSQHKYFQPPSSATRESIHLAKKRKISKPSSERFCSSLASLISRSSTSGSRVHHSSTPKARKSFTQSMHKTNTSAARLQFRRSKDSMEK